MLAGMSTSGMVGPVRGRHAVYRMIARNRSGQVRAEVTQNGEFANRGQGGSTSEVFGVNNTIPASSSGAAVQIFGDGNTLGTSTTANVVVLGNSNNIANFGAAIVLGSTVSPSNTSIPSGAIVIGSGAVSTWTMYVGGYAGFNAGTACNITAMQPTNSNVQGTPLSIYAGVSTGNAAPGVLNFDSTATGSSGSTAQTRTTVLQITNATTITTTDAVNHVFGSSTGTKIGTATTQKLGFWNVTPVVQPAGANQAVITDSTGGTASFTLADVTATPTQTLINNNFASLARQVDAIRTALVTAGIIKGAAADAAFAELTKDIGYEVK